MNRPKRRTRNNTFTIQGRYGYRKSKPACFNGSNRNKGPKARRAPITLAERA